MAIQSNRYYEIQNVRYGSYMNMYGNFSGSTIPDATKLSLWTSAGGTDQSFAPVPYNGSYKLANKRNPDTHLVNRHSGNAMAIMWNVAGSSAADSVIYFEPVANQADVYRIRLNLKSPFQYLTATSATGYLYWQTSLATTDTSQHFRMLPTNSYVSSSGYGQVGAPSFTGHLVSHAGTGRALNVYGTESIENNRNVCLYDWGDNNAQTWKLASYNGDLKLFSNISYPTFALNVYRGDNNCNVLAHADNDADSHLYRTAVSGKSGVFTVRLKYGERAGYALTADGNYDLCNVSWQLYTGAENQQWLFTATKPAAPSVGSPVFDGHLVSDAGNGLALNVYGDESIDNNRNVCLYEWGNNNAQAWKLASYNGDMKLFSGLNYPTFALNVYRADNNCTVLSHTGNDEDSHIYRTAVTGKPDVYTVRLKSGERAGYALTAQGNSNLSNVSWQPYSAGNTMQQWLFTNSKPATPTVGTPIFTGHLVSDAGAGRALNVYGTESISDGRNVCLYTWGDNNAQTWKLASYKGDLKLFSALEYSTYALNVYRGGDNMNNCTVLSHAGNEDDSHIYRTAVTGKPGVFTVRLKSGERADYALTAEGNYDLCNVSWQPYVAGNTKQQWLFTASQPEESEVPGIGRMVFEGHIVSFAGAGYTLNISGNEEVSDNRNVNVWYWSEPVTGAQTWRQVECGTGTYKILSKLQYPTYGLNVKTNTYNCDMLRHDGNEADSIVKITPVAGKADTYYIQLAGGTCANRYLTVGNADSAASVNSENVAWWPKDYENPLRQQWKFTTTKAGPVEPPVTEFIADSDKVNYMRRAKYFVSANRTPANIREITIHHMDAVWTVQQLGAFWANPNPDRAVSSHYGVYEFGVGQYVMEKDIAHTNGHESNNWAVTIEVGDMVASGDYPCSVNTFNTLVNLVADIAWRNGLHPLTPYGNLKWHKLWDPTNTCPGNYLISKMPELASRANAINDNKPKNIAVYPMENMRITQDHNGSKSHAACSQGTPHDLPFDEAGKDGGIEAMICPVDEMVLTRKYTEGTNTVWVRSTSKVQMPCGEDYLCMMIIHPETADINQYDDEHLFHRGDPMFKEGTSGGVPAHLHISCGRGDFTGDGWARNTNPQGSNNTYVITTDGGPITASQAFYLDSSITTVHDTKTYTFQPKP